MFLGIFHELWDFLRLPWRELPHKTCVLLIAVTLALVCVANTGMLVQAAPACKDHGSTDAAPVTFGKVDERFAAGLNISFFLGLTPASFPAENIAKIAPSCSRGSFAVSDSSYTLFGDRDTSPERWASASNGAKAVAFLALMPRPEPALGWYEKYQSDKNVPAKFDLVGSSMYALTVTDGAKRQVYMFYDKIPADNDLQRQMQNALAGNSPVIATYNVETHQTEF